MKFNRMLATGFLALVCAGTAAASQLNAVRVTPKANAATVTLQTSGSFAHKEYRPDAHLLLVDLTGVTSDAKLAHAVALNSPVLKSYAVSTYTNAAGSVVTRVELALADKVTTNVADAKDGLQIDIRGDSNTISPAASAKQPAPAGAPLAAKPTAAKQAVATPAPAKPTAAPAAAVATVKPANPVQTVAAGKVAAPVPAKPASVAPVQAAAPAKPNAAVVPVAAKAAVSVKPAPSATIHSISIQQQQDSVDVVVDGPSSAHAYRMNNPERLVVDFTNVVMDSSVRAVPVHTPDVVRVRVGHPPNGASRVVVDLTGPRPFEVLPSADRVIVRIKTGATAAMAENKPAENKAGESKARLKQVSAPVPSTADAQPVPVSPKAADAAPVAAAKPASAVAEQTAAPSRPEKAANEIARLVSPDVPASISAGLSSQSATRPRYTGEPISVNLKDVDLKDFFRLIHEISGLNIVLDPSVHGSVTLVLDNVPWDQALDIVLKNNGLDRELAGNVLRIAGGDTLRREAVDRRAQAEAVALAVDRQTITRTLSYARAGSVVPTVKKFLTARGEIISDDRTNALIISDIPSVIPTLDRLIAQLDQKTQEVEIELRVVSASRAFSRDLGVQLGFAWGNGTTLVGGLNNVGQSTVTNNGTTSKIPLFSNFPAGGATTGLGIANITGAYMIDAALTAAESHSLAKVLSRPRVVTQNNVRAEVKQGVKIPVYTSGTANANSSVTYIEAVLRLSVTPQVTADNTIFLMVDVENTQPSGQLNGNFILSTQQATTQVLVTDGGTVVIGGVIQTSNKVGIQQTPVLGNIPWLGNLFKERSVTTDTEELIFFITPKIIQT